jgi:hypothetical protein
VSYFLNLLSYPLKRSLALTFIFHKLYSILFLFYRCDTFLEVQNSSEKYEQTKINNILKDYRPGPSGIHPRNARMLQTHKPTNVIVYRIKGQNLTIISVDTQKGISQNSASSYNFFFKSQVLVVHTCNPR